MILGALSQYTRDNASSGIDAELRADINANTSNTNITTSPAASWWRRRLSPSLSLPFPRRSSSKSATSRRRTRDLDVAWRVAVAATMYAWLACLVRFGASGQPDTYMTAMDWKNFLSEGEEGNASWFARWNAMAQPRINQLVSRVEAKGAHGRKGGGSGASLNFNGSKGGPFRLTMVGDSTMMHQFGLMCAFLGERAGRRFDPAVHQKECCIDTLMAGINDENSPGKKGFSNSTSNDKDPHSGVGGAGVDAEFGGGRGLCVRHVFETYATQPAWESKLGSPDAVYFGAGLHLLHMKRPSRDVIPQALQGWLTYEEDLENVVENYRAQGGDGFSVIFMTTHVIQDTMYEGEFKQVADAYHNNDTKVIAVCENQVHRTSKHSVGREGFHEESYCRRGLLDRYGSELLNRRARPVMDRLGVPLVQCDLIVKGQAWATGREDGRHFRMLVPAEVWELLGVLVSPFEQGVAF